MHPGERKALSEEKGHRRPDRQNGQDQDQHSGQGGAPAQNNQAAVWIHRGAL